MMMTRRTWAQKPYGNKESSSSPVRVALLQDSESEDTPDPGDPRTVNGREDIGGLGLFELGGRPISDPPFVRSGGRGGSGIG